MNSQISSSGCSQPASPATVQRSAPVDGFRLAYERRGGGRAVVALHGWPSDRHDWTDVASRVPEVDFVAVDLRGFGDSDAHAHDPARAYTPAAQAASVLGLIDELGLGPVVLVGYDLGSMVAEQVARARPDIVGGLILAPPLPGLARRISEPASLRERWYITFHQTQLAGELIDAQPDAVRAYLAHFWSRWSGSAFVLGDAELDRLTAAYARPGAFLASTAVYRSGRPGTDGAPLHAPATVLWPDSDPLFPIEWAADIDSCFTDAELQTLPAVGHFTPREAPERFAAAIRRHAGRG